MPLLRKGNQFWRVALAAPAVAVAYAAIAYAVVVTGCLPPFSDVDFFDVPVTVFLLLALTATALILIVFAALNVGRVVRVMRRRRASDILTRRGLALTGFALVAGSLALTAWLSFVFLQTTCG